MPDVLIIDSTLRDGNHAVRHQLDASAIALYTKGAEEAKIPIVIVGHGNGLGANSLQVGESALSDKEAIRIARNHLTHTQLGVYMIPGFATIKRDLTPALDAGVDVVCVGCHCTETDTTKRYIDYVRQKNRLAYANLMMIHMIPTGRLVEECLKSQSYGASGVILMDSAGALVPQEVSEKISMLTDALDIPIGFHAHNNLSLAIANSLAALDAGAKIIDCCTRGFGAGAGNAQLEVVVAVLQKMHISTGIDLYSILDLADTAENSFMKEIPKITSVSLVSGLAGVFSGFAAHVKRVAKQYDVDPRDIFFKLGKYKAIAGQEDLIVKTALELAHSNMKKTEVGV